MTPDILTIAATMARESPAGVVQWRVVAATEDQSFRTIVRARRTV